MKSPFARSLQPLSRLMMVLVSAGTFMHAASAQENPDSPPPVSSEPTPVDVGAGSDATPAKPVAAADAAPEEIILLETKSPCAELLAKVPHRRGKISAAALPLGLMVGAASDVVMALTDKHLRLVPQSIQKWLPFLNETATVISTATGKKWIYSGLSRRVIDGIAVGALGGLGVRAGDDHGVVVGLLNFAAGVGLTYWLPTKYFKTWMSAIPGTLPKPLQKPGKTAAGQMVIGVTMIVLLEQILEQANHLIELLPRLFAEHRPSGSFPVRRIASVGEPPRATLNQALALFFLDGALDALEDGNQAATLAYLAGGHPVALSPSESRAVQAPLRRLLGKGFFRDLLSVEELSFVRARVALLAPPAQ